MTRLSLLVIGKPGSSHLKVLDSLPASVKVTVSNLASELRESAAGADVILNGAHDAEMLRQIFPRAARLRWVHAMSAGVEKLLFPELVASLVILTNSRGIFSPALAEFVVGAVLFFAKDFRRLIRSQQAGEWQPFKVEDVRGKVMTIIGYGETGRACAERARALGMNVLAVRRRPELSQKDPWVEAIFPLKELPALLRQSHYVVLATPATPDTHALMGQAEFEAMKRSAVFINVGRGVCVDEAAMIAALENTRIRGAALDVYQTEPLPPDHPLYRLENVLLSPHCADQTSGTGERLMALFVQNLQRFMAGEALSNVVDKVAGY